MLPANQEVTKQVANATINYPMLLTFFQECQKSELDKLPFAGPNLQVASGRCQVWADIVRFLESSKTMAAKS